MGNMYFRLGWAYVRSKISME